MLLCWSVPSYSPWASHNNNLLNPQCPWNQMWSLWQSYLGLWCTSRSTDWAHKVLGNLERSMTQRVEQKHHCSLWREVVMLIEPGVSFTQWKITRVRTILVGNSGQHGVSQERWENVICNCWGIFQNQVLSAAHSALLSWSWVSLMGKVTHDNIAP